MPPEILLATLEDLKADAQDRYQRLSEMPTDVCPEGKLTREMARDPRFRMPVRVLVLEEFQEYYDLGPISKDIAELLQFLVKVAPGAGIILLCSTQKPSGIGGGGELGQRFTGFRDNFAIRFGLRTSSWQVSEMCLGQGAYSEGLDTSTLLPQYKGVGILRGASDASPTVRTYLADGQDAERILTAARAIRERAGTLSGMALGEDEAPQRDVLADVLEVLGRRRRAALGRRSPSGSPSGSPTGGPTRPPTRSARSCARSASPASWSRLAASRCAAAAATTSSGPLAGREPLPGYVCVACR